jgi:hypothetical protein
MDLARLQLDKLGVTISDQKVEEHKRLELSNQPGKYAKIFNSVEEAFTTMYGAGSRGRATENCSKIKDFNHFAGKKVDKRPWVVYHNKVAPGESSVKFHKPQVNEENIKRPKGQVRQADPGVGRSVSGHQGQILKHI